MPASGHRDTALAPVRGHGRFRPWTDLLPRLFQAVILSAAVQAELRHARAPAAVRDWINDPPPWLRVEPTPPLSTLPFPRLDSGERAAIALAQSLGADIVLMDDRDGVTAASRRSALSVYSILPHGGALSISPRLWHG